MHREGTPEPVRVSTVRDGGVRDLPTDWKALSHLYTTEILPEALRADRDLIAAMRRVLPDHETPAFLRKALNDADDDTEKRYVLDLVREDLYLALHRRLRAVQLKGKDRDETKAWGLAARVSRVDAAYGEGRYGDVAHLLGGLGEHVEPAAASPGRRPR